MNSITLEESLRSHTPESNPEPIAKPKLQERAIDGWRENYWRSKRERDELAGYVFDPDLLREGSD